MDDQPLLKLHGQRVVIVGGTSGMGQAAAIAARREGASVIVAGRRPVEQRDASDPGVSHEVVDVASEPSVRALFDRVGEIDHLLVTAAPPPGSWRPFLEDDVEGAERYLRAKFLGSWACARYAAPWL